MSRAVATLLFCGLSPVAPGTVGSLAALILGWLLHQSAGLALFALGWALISALGWWAIDAQTRATGAHDASEYVIDELSGQWIALLPVLMVAPASLPMLAAAFILFRLFDITKPGPIGWADRQEGAFFVMLDDILAGLAAALLIGLVLWLF